LRIGDSSARVKQWLNKKGNMENKKTKILVVDDENDVVETLKHALTIRGYETIGAFSANEALCILEREKADLILMDIMMPGIKGTDAARIIKEKYPAIKLIVVTGYPGESESLLKENITEGVLIKPIRLQEIYNKLVETFNQNANPITNLKSAHKIKASIILIKARLLFAESSLEIYNYISARFKFLCDKGEVYEMDIAGKEETIITKLSLFHPGIIFLNAAAFKDSIDMLLKVLEKDFHSTEMVIYNVKNPGNLQKSELDQLIKTARTVCLKNGLIEIKMIEI